MADLEKTVAIIFEGVDQMGAGVDSSVKRIDSITDSVESIAEPLAKGTKALLTFEAAALAMAIALGSRAYDAAVRFESAQAELAKTLGDDDGTVEDYTRQITELSNTYGESSTNLLASMANYKQAGFTADEALGLVKSGLDLVIAGDLEAAQASEVLVATLKGFKAPASDANELLEVLNASSNSYATNVDQLSQGMARLSPIASTMGLNFEESAELLIPIIEVFRSGSEAANALRTGLLRLGDDSAPVVTTLEGLEIAQRDANGVLRDSSDILKDVAEATIGMADSEKLYVAQQLFGIEQSAKMVTVLDAIATSSVDVGAAMEKTASVSEEVAIRLGTAEKAGDRARESFENLARTLGTEFKDEMVGIQNAMTEVFVQFERAAAEGALDEFFDAITPTLDEIKRLALEVAEALPEALSEADYSGFADGMQALFGGLEDVTITAEDLKAIIEGLANTFRTLSEFTAGTVEVIGGLIAVIKPVIEAFLELDGDTQRFIGTIGGLSLVVSPAVGAIGSLTKAVAALAGKSGVVAQAAPVIGSLVGVMTGPLGLAVAAAGAATGIVTMGRDILETNASIDASRKANADLAQAIRDGSVVWDYAVDDYVAAADAQITLEDKLRASQQALIDWTKTLGGTLTEQEREARMIEEVNAQWINWDEVVDAAWKSSQSFNQEQKATADGLEKVLAAIGPVESAWTRVGEGIYENVTNIAELESAYADVKTAFEEGLITQAQFDELTEYYESLRDGAAEGVDSQKKLAEEVLTSEEAILKAREAVLEYELSLEELASNERIKSMEFAASISVAALEADAKKVEAILSATSDTIAAMGESVSSLFGTMASEDLSFRQQWDLEDAIQQQLDIQKQAADDQTKLINAQIDALRAKTEALRNGDGLINISSDGLEPALEMIMWQIIEKVQLRANAEGAEFLLGLN